MVAGKLYRMADLESALQANAAYFNSAIIKPLARRGAEQALKRAVLRAKS
jgi:hypothetical protein